MTRSIFRRHLRVGLAVLFSLLLGLPCLAPARGQTPKEELTGYFYQMDSEAGFEGDGSNFCAPTAVSNGLMYLARARGMRDLVPGTGQAAHITLIKALAEQMETDPDEGTPPSRVLSGLEAYVHGRGYRLAHVGMAGWRGLDREHRSLVVSKRPSLAWMREAALDPDTVMIFNNGWYRSTDDGYVRKGGHFVVVAGAGPGQAQFQVHNSALELEEQRARTSVALTPITEDLTADASKNGVEELDLRGYFSMKGPGLPYSSKKAAFAVLDFVMVFQIRK